MSDQYSRRAVCGAVGAVLLGGCVGGASEEPSNNTTQDPDNETMNPSDDSSTADTTPIPPEERQQLVDQLPETSPLVNSLVDLVAAPDRETKAEELGHEFRSEDHSVRVNIKLESEATLPDDYRVTVESSYQGTIDAYVHVDDLVPLAMNDAVRIIRPPAESQTHNSL